jgi:acyl transferase domain-containing protein
LLGHHPVFRQALERCDAAVPRDAGFSIVEQLQLDPASPRCRLQEIGVIQPTLLAVEIALAELWRSWGITPEAVIGHSMGEVAAAHVAGTLSLAAAMHLICKRSALLQRTSGQGAMALVALDLEQTTRRLADRAELVSVAASNGPRSTVVSGEPAAVTALLAELEQDGVFCRAVQVDVASHSPQMDPLVPELVDSLASMTTSPASAAHYSTVYGRRLDDGECGPDYWGRNLRHPVMFAQAVAQTLSHGMDAVIEMGPHPTLLASVAETGAGSVQPLTLASLRRNEPERVSLLVSLGALWASGHPVSWGALFPSGTYAPVALPHYPWQRERHWPDAAMSVPNDSTRRRVRLDDAARSWLYAPEWTPAPTARAESVEAAWLLVADSTVAPCAQQLAAALRSRGGSVHIASSLEAAVDKIAGASPVELQRLRIVFVTSPGDPTPALGAVTAVQVLQRSWPEEAGRFTPRLYWITSCAHLLPGQVAVPHGPAHASLWGAARVLAQEHPDWWGGLVDIDLGDLAGSPSGSADLLAEHLCVGTNEDQVKLIGPERLALRLTSTAASVASGEAPRWRTDVAYLITGGFGGIAQRIAMAMVHDGARRLVLLGRSALPPRAAWAAEPGSTEAGRRIAVVQALERAGASVHLVQADVSNEDAADPRRHPYGRRTRQPADSGDGRRCLRARHGTEAVRCARAGPVAARTGSVRRLLLHQRLLGPCGHDELRGRQRWTRRAGAGAARPGPARPQHSVGPVGECGPLGGSHCGPKQPRAQALRSGIDFGEARVLDIRVPVGPARAGGRGSADRLVDIRART